MAKRRKSTLQRSRVNQAGIRPGFSRRPPARTERTSRFPWTWLALGAVAIVGVLLVGAYAAGVLPGTGSAAPTPAPTVNPEALHPPDATPLANPPAEPAGNGTTAVIQTDVGNVVLELYTDSAPVAAQNFINLANAGFYNGVGFHRIVPDFVIQGGDPEGTGRGGPGYTIQDEPVVGEYGRGTVAMARSQAPNSQGSQFFIVLSEDAREALDAYRTYVIFGQVLEGMDVVDQIAGGPRTGPDDDLAANPVIMRRVTIQPPGSV